VDCLQNGRWYCSTILDVKRNSGDRTPKRKKKSSQRITEYLVGFRRYDPEGNKVDMEGKSFFGLNESSDEWVPVIWLNQVESQRLLPRLSLSNPHNKLNYDECQDDPNDFLLAELPILAIGRESVSQSSFLINLLNDIAPNLSPLIASLSQAPSLDYIRFILSTFDNVSKLMLKQQGSRLLAQLAQTAMAQVLELTRKNCRNFQNQTIDVIILSLSQILARVSNNDLKNLSLFHFQLSLVLVYLNSDILERQIQALRIFSDL